MLQRYVFSVRKNALRSQVNEQDRSWMFGPGDWVGKKQRLADATIRRLQVASLIPADLASWKLYEETP
jgi:hypothetical protein